MDHDPAPYRLVDDDPEPDVAHRMTFVTINEDGSFHAVVDADGTVRLAVGDVRPGEDYLLDTTLRVPLETAAFRYQQVQPFAVEDEAEGLHVYAWVEGSPYDGHRAHADVAHTSLPAEELVERLRAQDEPAAAKAVADAASSYRRQDDESYYRRNLRTLTPAYLRGTTAEEGSGFGGDSQRWRRQRESIVNGLDRDGTFLDIGCANGLLMESVQTWAGERGLRIEPYGVDLAPELVELARTRLPHWAKRIEVGNAIDYLPSDGRRFTFVHALLDCVPDRRRVDLITHCLDHLVEPAGRLLVSLYADRPAARGYLEALGLAVDGKSQHTAWITGVPRPRP